MAMCVLVVRESRARLHRGEQQRVYVIPTR